MDDFVGASSSSSSSVAPPNKYASMPRKEIAKFLVGAGEKFQPSSGGVADSEDSLWAALLVKKLGKLSEAKKQKLQQKVDSLLYEACQED